MNLVILKGNLTKDPELKHTSSGNAVAGFTVATKRDYGEDAGADYIPCVAWKKTAETIHMYLHKGSPILVRGRLQYRKYTNRDGQEVKVAEVIVDSFEFCDKKESSTNDGDLPF